MIRTSNLSQKSTDHLIKILKENPQWLKAIYLPDLIKICEHFSSEALQDALKAQIAVSKSMTYCSLKADVPAADKRKLESKIPRESPIWSDIYLKDPNDKSLW